MSAERDDAILKFFEGQRHLERSAGDAAALAIEKLESLREELDAAAELDEVTERKARADRQALIYEASASLGRACVDGLGGLVASGAVDKPALRIAAVQTYAPPLDDAWQVAENPFTALAEIAESQEVRIGGLREQPNQLYR